MTNKAKGPGAAKRRGRPAWVQNAYHIKIRFSVALGLMDDGIRRWVDAYVFNGKKAKPQRFFNAYCVHHKLTKGETFICNRKEWGDDGTPSS